jgi:hypothetical protein
MEAFESKKPVTEAGSSCSESIEENIEANNMENHESSEKLQAEPSKNISTSRSSTSIIKARPDSLKLSFDYSSSSDLAKSTASVDVNQGKSLSVAGNKSHHDGKMSYDLWVNENVEAKERNGSSAGEKKLDLPGRVSFR